MNQSLPLAGLNVLVTRPGAQGLKLAGLVTDNGGSPIVLPLIEINPLVDEAAVTAIQSSIENLATYDVAIFISVNAVNYGIKWIQKFWPQLPETLQVVAVGPATRDALKPYASDVHCSNAGAQSEDILELPVLKQVAGRRVALFRGKGGRELLATSLRERGAVVDYVETYERSTPEFPPGHVSNVIIESQVNAITVTSGQVLDSLCELVDIKTSVVNQIPILVPSARIDQLATQAGFNAVINCSGADDKALLNGLELIAQKHAAQRE